MLSVAYGRALDLIDYLSNSLFNFARNYFGLRYEFFSNLMDINNHFMIGYLNFSFYSITFIYIYVLISSTLKFLFLTDRSDVYFNLLAYKLLFRQEREDAQVGLPDI
ncbi:hypothetical protein RF11_03600 [Thelohanellus kitauei]|uniref:Uncharacterized protein n=1 Tax=Thelohanellus kitauei TaxID=669202 RepID=A0A0C2MN51_THEKT|nr:hypothetical protein RF11_03600 [Thelohanellus kitauei]